MRHTRDQNSTHLIEMQSHSELRHLLVDSTNVTQSISYLWVVTSNCASENDALTHMSMHIFVAGNAWHALHSIMDVLEGEKCLVGWNHEGQGECKNEPSFGLADNFEARR